MGLILAPIIFIIEAILFILGFLLKIIKFIFVGIIVPLFEAIFVSVVWFFEIFMVAVRWIGNFLASPLGLIFLGLLLLLLAFARIKNHPIHWIPAIIIGIIGGFIGSKIGLAMGSNGAISGGFIGAATACNLYSQLVIHPTKDNN